MADACTHHWQFLSVSQRGIKCEQCGFSPKEPHELAFVYRGLKARLEILEAVVFELLGEGQRTWCVQCHVPLRLPSADGLILSALDGGALCIECLQLLVVHEMVEGELKAEAAGSPIGDDDPSPISVGTLADLASWMMLYPQVKETAIGKDLLEAVAGLADAV